MIMLRTIGARFASASAVYTYFVPTGDEPSVGDLIVTSIYYTPSAGVGSNAIAAIADAKVATVVELHEPGAPGPKANKFYMALVKAKDIAARADSNLCLMAQVKNDRVARAELNAMLAAEDTRLRYQRLAESNPRARELLEQIGELPPAKAKPTPAVPKHSAGWDD